MLDADIATAASHGAVEINPYRPVLLIDDSPETVVSLESQLRVTFKLSFNNFDMERKTINHSHFVEMYRPNAYQLTTDTASRVC